MVGGHIFDSENRTEPQFCHATGFIGFSQLLRQVNGSTQKLRLTLAAFELFPASL
jgi:hypothetical protein